LFLPRLPMLDFDELDELEQKAGAKVEAAEASAPKLKIDDALKAEIQAKAETKRANGAFDTYCFKYKVQKFPLANPKMRMICFHNAGSTESNYTRPNTAFTNWIVKEAKDVELIAVDFPGRNKLLKEKAHTSIETLAPDLLATLYDKVADGVPYIVWAHSVGTWVALEFMILVRKIGLPMPKAAVLTGFPGAHMPEGERRWRKSASLDDAGMKEETFNWDPSHFKGPGKVIFEDDFWTGPSGCSLMRADFRLYDEYVFKHFDEPKFDFPIHSMHMEDERIVLPEQVQLWEAWTTAKFDFRVMKGMGHLSCFIMPDKIRPYFTAVTDIIKEYHAGL